MKGNWPYVILDEQEKSRVRQFIQFIKSSHKKRKDSLETRAVLLIFSLHLEISGVAVQSMR